MKYTREHLDEACTIHDLRRILTELGGTPSNLNKSALAEEILKIQDGVVPSPKIQGRKSKSEKYKELKEKEQKEYEYDEYTDVIVGENRDLVEDEVNYDAMTRVVGTFEKSEGYDHGFLRGDNFKSSAVSDVYVSAHSVRYFRLKDGDIVDGYADRDRDNGAPSLKKINFLNGRDYSSTPRVAFNDLESIYPTEKLKLEHENQNDVSLRAIDLLAPIGKGQRGLIVAPPKAGKTTLLKKIASSIAKNHEDVYLMVVLIGERPEEVTDFKRSINCELIYSTFDEKVKNQVRLARLAIEKAKRQVEAGKDVVVLLDSITKLTRAYNETLPSSGKTLTGGIDPVALQEAKSLFGSARNVDGEGSLTIIATALVDTGSRADDVIYEEFKGTGNSEIFLLKSLAERRVFPAIDLYRSGTRKDELLLSQDALNLSYALRRDLDGTKDAELKVLTLFAKTATNEEFIKNAGKIL